MKTIKQMIDENHQFKRDMATFCPIGYWIYQIVDNALCGIIILVLICGFYAAMLKLLDSQSYIDYLLSFLKK